MNARYESKISNCFVANLGNSPAITCNLRLAFEYFDSHITSPRINQRFHKTYIIGFMKKLILAMTASLLFITGVSSDAAVERRKDQFGKDFGYYVYPIAGEIPGLGTAAGVGASVLNMGGNDVDFTGYAIDGDFEARGFALLDYHIIDKRRIFDFGYNDYLVAPIAYDRGIYSDPDDVIHPKAEGGYLLGQMTYTFDERRYEIFVRALNGRERILEVLDKDGVAFPGVDAEWERGTYYSIGGSIDLTDDRLDPRRGWRVEFAAKLPHDTEADESRFFVTDYNFSAYLPMRRWDTLAFNLFHSRSHVTRKGETDFAMLQAFSGLNCDQYLAGPNRNNCLNTESKYLQRIIANNRYGTASPLVARNGYALLITTVFTPQECSFMALSTAGI